MGIESSFATWRSGCDSFLPHSGGKLKLRALTCTVDTKNVTSRRSDSLSPEDRAFLEQEAMQAQPVTGVARLGMALFAAILAVALAFVAVFLAGLLARLFGFAIANGAWRDHPVTFYGAFVVGGVVLLLQAVSYLRWWLRARRSRSAYVRSVSEDLSTGTVTVEDHDVIAVKLLQEPEHHAFIFLLLLSNGKTLVLYDYDSYDGEDSFPPDNQPKLVPCEKISLSTFPKSRRRRWAFSGTPLPVPVAIELALEPDKWPEDESWCRVKWANIERHYGPSGLQAAASRRS
ncbi:MAG: phage holin family protein [Tabrizicola sp.]